MSEPVVEPEAALVEPEGPIGEVRPFAAWLQEFRGGALHQELSFLLQQAVTAVRDHQSPATITLQIRLETTKVSDAAFEVSLQQNPETRSQIPKQRRRLVHHKHHDRHQGE